MRLGGGLLLAAFAGLSAAQTADCPDGKPADGVQRAGDARQCLVMQRLEPPQVKLKTLVVYLHGDSGGKTGPDDSRSLDRSVALALSERLGAAVIALQRPGYRSAAGRSDGDAPAAGDDYTAGNVAAVAAALNNLRKLNPARKVLLVGYSGGAATAALLASRFPGSADAYLLAACPCDVPAWRQWRKAAGGSPSDATPWTRSLSPVAETAGIRPDTLVSVVVGAKDENTLPKFSEAWVGALQAKGVKTRLTYAAGATHVSVVRSPEFFMLAEDLAVRLSK
ncbi:MAG: alpha/beta fold hydrolase [Comamonadaceae bacterium]|nr:MAG: alpha/beta fold hydrolase [Comamonadaceae bacterium]